MSELRGARPGGRVAVITRLTMQNAGNEGLSAELIRLVTACPQVGDARVLDRHPRYFQSFTLAALQPAGGQAAALDRLADRLIARHRPGPGGDLAPSATVDQVRLNTSGRRPDSVIDRLKRRLGVRRNLARLGVIGRADLRRALNTLAWADLIIWNPAGELHPGGSLDEPMRLLLLLRIAQRLGVATAIVNHSLEIDPPLREIISHVYRAASHVIVRDARSIEVAREIGVDPGRLREAPDLVFNAGTEETKPVVAPLPAGAIVLAINGLQAMTGQDEWRRLIERLEALGRPLIFLGNSTDHDGDFGRGLKRYGAVQVGAVQPGYRELRALYAGCGCVVASRLHASILALTAGTPVVSIEPSVFKLTAVFEQLNYAYPTDDLGRAGWADRVADRVEHALARGEALRAETLATVSRQREAIVQAYEPLLSFPDA